MKSKQQKLKEKLDRIFSEYIRRKGANREGYALCVTCGVSKPWQEQQAGHYIPRNILATRFDEENVHIQCVSCNVFKKGMMDEYALFLTREYGPEILSKLSSKKHKPTKLYVGDYEQMIKHYQDELKSM